MNIKQLSQLQIQDWILPAMVSIFLALSVIGCKDSKSTDSAADTAPEEKTEAKVSFDLDKAVQDCESQLEISVP